MDIDSNLGEELKQLNRESADFYKKCQSFIFEINFGELTIVQLVEQLGVLLVDSSPNHRELGAWILTKVLEGLSPNHFNEEQLKFICNFYADRLKDHHQVIPAVLAGLVVLAKFDKFPKENVGKILTALFQNVACQQQQEQDRRNIFRFFEIVSETCKTELGDMGLDFIYGVISAADGERNPKNLILLFKWFPKFLKIVNLGHLTEEAFEILGCYFPVDFKAPPQDSNAITRDQLAEALAPCLTAIPQFAEFCLPLILEKLDASLDVAKIDALKLLEISCSTFDVSSYVQHSSEIWSNIQKEIFNHPNPVIESHCLKTLTAVIKKISDDHAVYNLIKDICDTIKGNLLPDSKLFEPSSKLLLSVAQGSEISCDIVVKEIIPILVNTFNITTQKHQTIILRCLVNFFNIYVIFHNQIEFEELKIVPILCLRASCDDYEKLQIVAFESLAFIVKSLPQDVRFSIYDNLQNIFYTRLDPAVKNAMLLCFEELAKNYPDEIKTRFWNLEISDVYTLEAYFDVLSVIISQEYFTEIIINLLIDYFPKMNFSRIVIKSVRKILQNGNTYIQSILFAKNIITVIIDWSLMSENFGMDHLENVSFLEDVSFILKTMIGLQNCERQKEIISRELPKISELNPFRIFLLDGVVCHLQRDVEINYGVLNELTRIILSENYFVIKNTSAQLLANILNKCRDDILLDYLEQFDENQKDLTLMTWITKALVMRNHSLANTWIDKLLDLLTEDENVASCFRIIINDNFDSLSQKSHCVRNVLYQQKFFTIVTTKLNENYKPEYNSYLLALGYLLENTPKQVILLQFQKIFRLIILCLDQCQDPEILIVILQIIKDLTVKKEKCIDDHITDFLTRFLKLSIFEKSMHVRILSLQCLQECTSSFPVYKLLIHKPEVVRVLGKSIDDKKRNVRREAVEARSLWYLLDAVE